MEPYFTTLSLVAFIAFVFFYKKQTQYYKNMMDSVNDIILIYKDKSMIEMNKSFYNFFEDDKKCISEFFLDEDGYLQKNMDGVYWLDYLKENNHCKIVVHQDNKRYFNISIKALNSSKIKTVVVLSEITQEVNKTKELEQLVITDLLTKVGNHHHAEDELVHEVSKSKRHDYPLSLVLMDIDDFKEINLQYTHEMGDKVLVEYASLIASVLRDEDIFCRISDKEFFLILPENSLDNARKTAEKIRMNIEMHHKVLPITMSFGVIEYNKDEDKELNFKRLKLAHDKAKINGKNRVEIL